MKPLLDIHQDLRFQYRQWRLERIGWVFIASVIVAALSGLFGHHPLARARDQTPDGRLSIEYERYARNESNVELRVTVEPHGEDVVRVWFEPDYLDALQVTGISPVPLRGEAGTGGRAFVFQTDGERFTATVFVQFHTIGFVHGRVRVNEEPALTFTQVVWP